MVSSLQEKVSNLSFNFIEWDRWVQEDGPDRVFWFFYKYKVALLKQ
jgi:hypothetical protein